MQISFCGLLTVLFIALKMLEVITWSWFWVLTPLWGPALLALIFALLSAWADS